MLYERQARVEVRNGGSLDRGSKRWKGDGREAERRCRRDAEGRCRGDRTFIRKNLVERISDAASKCHAEGEVEIARRPLHHHAYADVDCIWSGSLPQLQALENHLINWADFLFEGHQFTP